MPPGYGGRVGMRRIYASWVWWEEGGIPVHTPLGTMVVILSGYTGLFPPPGYTAASSHPTSCLHISGPRMVEDGAHPWGSKEEKPVGGKEERGLKS